MLSKTVRQLASNKLHYRNLNMHHFLITHHTDNGINMNGHPNRYKIRYL
jgi:hypothetical protein